MARSLFSKASVLSIATAISTLVASSAFLQAQTNNSAPRVDVLDGVAAVVNNEVITFSQIREVVSDRVRSLRELYSGQELTNRVAQLNMAAVNELIDRQLILQEFKKNKGYSIPDYVIDEHIKGVIRDQFGNDRQAFLRTIEAQGYTLAKFRQLETDKIIVQAMRQKNVKITPVIPPQAVGEYYSKHIQEFSTKDQVKLRMILIRAGDAGDQGKKKEAEEILSRLKEGAKFDAQAQLYSEDSTATSGGDWGWIDRSTLNATLTAAAFQLKPGQFSPLITLNGNFYILTVDERKNGVTQPLSAVRQSIEEKLMQEERQKQMQHWVDGLRKKAYIHIF